MSGSLITRGSSARRIGALLARHYFLLRKSWPRLLSFAYYPVMQLLVWGFVTQYLGPQSASQGVLQAVPGILLTGVLLWDVLVRGELGLFLSFLEEMYSRNLGNLFVSPLRLHEFVIARRLSLIHISRQYSRLVAHHDVVAAFISSASNRGQSRRVVAWSFALASRRGNAHQQCCLLYTSRCV